jgi:AcrR family transcriptional regulator
MTTQPSLRERKKARTRRALIDAATHLFDKKGYDETTVAEITAAADISTRTFFSYFSSKEEVLFADSPLKLQIMVETLASRRPGETPADLLMRAAQEVIGSDTDMLTPLAHMRVRMLMHSPALQGRALRQVVDAGHQIALRLLAAFPDELDPVTAAAMVGSLVGTLVFAIIAILDDPERAAQMTGNPDRMRAELHRALQVAMDGLAGVPAAGEPVSGGRSGDAGAR